IGYPYREDAICSRLGGNRSGLPEPRTFSRRSNMASVEVPRPADTDWALANAWTWMVTGLVYTGIAVVLAALPGDPAAGLRYLLILLALLFAAVAVWIRLSSSRTLFLSHRPRGLQELALSLPLCLGLGLAVLRLLTMANAETTEAGSTDLGSWGVDILLVICWVLVAGIPLVRRWRAGRLA